MSDEPYQQHTLRDRIAAVLSDTLLAPISVCDAEVLADAVITELGLKKTLERSEIVEREGGLDVVYGRCRYITEWSDDG